MRILRNLIIISVLLVSVTVRASGVDELVRIKQNYARMLVPSGKDPFGLLSILSSIQPETEISDQVVVELHQRYPFDLKKIETYLSSFTEAGTWPDINYDDKKRSGWEPKIHAERILELVKLYNSDQTSYYRSSEVEAVIHKALNYWFTAKPVCLNWWYNQIGIPKTLGTVFILFEKQLTPVEKQNAISPLEKRLYLLWGFPLEKLRAGSYQRIDKPCAVLAGSAPGLFNAVLNEMIVPALWLDDMKVVLAPACVNVGVAEQPTSLHHWKQVHTRDSHSCHSYDHA